MSGYERLAYREDRLFISCNFDFITRNCEYISYNACVNSAFLFTGKVVLVVLG